MTVWDVSIIGAGRMGGKLIGSLLQFANANITAVYDSDPIKIGKTVNELYGYDRYGDLKVNDIKDRLLPCQGVLDFSRGDAVPENIPRIVEEVHPNVIIIGTTGIPSSFDSRLAELAKRTRIGRGSNWAEKMYHFRRELAKKTPQFPIPDGWEVDVYDIHHDRKRDAYSGTALDIAKTIADINGLGDNDILIPIPFSDSTLYVPFRELQEGHLDSGLTKYKSLRPSDKIILHSGTRAGNVVGYHKVEFRHRDRVEKIECDIKDRTEFAVGAFRALVTMLSYQDHFTLGKVYGPKDVFEFS